MGQFCCSVHNSLKLSSSISKYNNKININRIEIFLIKVYAFMKV